MALRFECDVIISSKVFADDTYGGYFIHDSSDVDVLARDGFDDLVVVALEVLDVFVRDAVLDEVVLVLQGEAFRISPGVTWGVISVITVTFEDAGTLLVLGVPLEDAFPFFLGQQLTSVLVKPPLVIVEDV